MSLTRSLIIVPSIVTSVMKGITPHSSESRGASILRTKHAAFRSHLRDNNSILIGSVGEFENFLLYWG